MTYGKDFKKMVRARMQRTGESYTTARAILLGKLATSQAPHARHDQTAALRRLISAAAKGGRLPAENSTEAWLLGLGGGISVQYFTFEYAGQPPILYVGTRCNPQYAYSPNFMLRALERSGLTPRVFEAGGAKGARDNVSVALAHGPAAAWVGREALAGEQAPMGSTPWVIVVHDLEDDHIAVEDIFRGVIELPLKDLLGAQGALRKARHRLIAVDGLSEVSLAHSVRAGLADCLEDLMGRRAVGGYEKNFGLQALEKWAAQAAAKGRKSWRATFAPGAGLFHGLAQLFGWVETASGGGGFRPMYAEFLREAGARLAAPSLIRASKMYQTLGGRWQELAQAPLQEGPGALRELEVLLKTLNHPPTLVELAPLAARGDEELRGAVAEGLYADLASRLASLAVEEKKAAALLEDALRELG